MPSLKLQFAEQFFVKNEEYRINCIAENRRTKDEYLYIQDESRCKGSFFYSIEVVRVKECDGDSWVDHGVHAENSFTERVMAEEIELQHDVFA